MVVRHFYNALVIMFLLAGVCHAEQVKLREAPLKTYNEKLFLNLMISAHNNTGNGYYSVNKKGVLDGSIRIESKESGYDKQAEAKYLFMTAVAGSFKDGKKNGRWEYRYVYDDGIDLYERHKTEIEYQNDKCIHSSFEGVIGHAMPKTRHEFEDQQYCTPEAMRNRAWEIWSEEFAKTKKTN